MARVIFYGKPTCGGNARQRARLTASGHEVEARDLFAHPWSAGELLTFLDGLMPADWFNPSAARIKSGEVDPLVLAADEALAHLMADPRLIRRPLLDIEGRRVAGWNEALLDDLIGLKAGMSVGAMCAHPASGRCDDTEPPR